ncbi:MAG: hypothetical protein PHZ03_06695 [Syntrophomonas sp.]|nr:hypothetical protein [Syntrophomonas sp.]
MIFGVAVLFILNYAIPLSIGPLPLDHFSNYTSRVWAWLEYALGITGCYLVYINRKTILARDIALAIILGMLNWMGRFLINRDFYDATPETIIVAILYVAAAAIFRSSSGYQSNTRAPKKLLSLRVHEGSIINGKIYYTSHDEKGLWCIGQNGDGKEQIPLPDTNDQSAFVDRITGWGDNLYTAVYLNGENNILQINLQTHQRTKLADGLGRVWRLCTDGKTLYAYDTKSPSDQIGNITVIPL